MGPGRQRAAMLRIDAGMTRLNGVRSKWLPLTLTLSPYAQQRYGERG
jgi:hypothetical protein